jgi:drug/metabolite transporter (DMT)-like permease
MVELVNSWSMSALPGSLYMLLKGSDVGWSMGLSYCILHKKYSQPQVLAAAMVMSGIGLVFFLDDNEEEEINNKNVKAIDENKAPQENSSWWTASTLCLGGAFLNAFCSILTEATLKKTLVQEETRLLEQQQQSPSKLLLSNFFSMYTSFFSFVLLTVPLFVSWVTTTSTNNSLQESMQVASSSSSSSCHAGQDDTMEEEENDTTARTTGTTTAALVVIFLCLILLALSRFAERIAKYWICVCDSAMTFSLVQAARRLSGVFVIAALFGEPFSSTMLIGSLVSGMGFFLHYWCSNSSQQSTESAANDQDKDHKYELVKSSRASSSTATLATAEDDSDYEDEEIVDNNEIGVAV